MKTSKASIRAMGALLGATLLYGCAHYNLPATHLETPEARGAGHVGRLEVLGLLMGTNLVERPTLSSPDPESGDSPVPEAQAAVAPSLGFLLPLDDRMEVGFRIVPMAPFTARFKYQFAGNPESQAQRGNLSSSVVVAPGILIGRGGLDGITYYSFDLSFPTGYRLWKNHLFSLTPYLTLAGLSGTSETAARSPSGGFQGTEPSASTSASIIQYGAGLGYQYSLEALFVRAEIAYGGGSIEETRLSGVYVGALLGFLLN